MRKKPTAARRASPTRAATWPDGVSDNGGGHRRRRDGLGRVGRQANANGSATLFFIAGSRTETVDPAGDRRVTYQSPRGRIVVDAAVLSAGFGDVFSDTATQSGAVTVARNTYDGQDRLVLATAPELGTTAYAYSPDLAHNIVQATRTPKPGSPLAPLSTGLAYDPVFNRPTRLTDPLGLVTTLSYDAATGNLLSAVADSGGAGHFNATSAFTYNSRGQVLTATDALGVTTLFAYDGLANPIAVTRDAGAGRLNQVTAMSYSASGDVTSLTDPNGNVAASSYDAGRRVTGTTAPAVAAAPGGLVTSFTYDPDGRLLATQQSAGGALLRTGSASYTPTGRLATVTDFNGNVARYGYDAADRLASVTDAAGRVTSFGYDALSRRTQLLNAAIQAAPLLQQSYTPDGLPASLVDAAGASHTTSFGYDGFDRLSATTYADASVETLSYDADGNLLTRRTRQGDTLRFAYDTLNRLATKTAAAAPVACGAAPSATPTVTYSYDLAGRLTGVCDNGAAIMAASGAASLSVSYGYDALNRPTSVAWPNVPAQTPPAAASVSFAHSYTAANQSSGETTTDNSWWTYPAAVAATTSYSANALNQYTAAGPSYDANGNLAADGGFAYCYDAESRLTGIVQGSCAAPSATVASYGYDAQGRRKSKTVAGTTTVYVTDADNREVLEYDGASGQTQRWNVFALGPDAVLNEVNLAANTRATPIPDIEGSIIATLDSGGALAKAAYLVFGENAAVTTGALRYTGRRFDAETAGSTAEPSGLYYYRARMYSPALGRFLQPDPIGTAGGVNLYAYVGNDPLNAIDPLGLAQDAQGSPATFRDPLSGMTTSEALTGAAMTVRLLGALGEASMCCLHMPAEAAALRQIGAAASVLEATAAAIDAQTVSNAVPQTLARVIPGSGPFKTLGPGVSDVFVTAAEDIRGITSTQQLAQRLAIPHSDTFTVVEFPTPAEGVASPINRSNPGFVGGGRTGGGAREFVVPNGPIPEGATIRIIGGPQAPIAR